MSNEEMRLDRIERIEQTVMEFVVCALAEYFDHAVEAFQYESDLPEDIAEDVMSHAVESMGVSKINERLVGKVDFKKALYAFVPEPCPVALMLDAKAENCRERRGDQDSVTIQLSQTSMMVMRRSRAGSSDILERGGLCYSFKRGDLELLVVTIVAKYVHTMVGDEKALLAIDVACIPNGMLQKRYSPTPIDTIWLAGKRSSSVRLSYRRLRAKAPWRFRQISARQSAGVLVEVDQGDQPSRQRFKEGR